MGERLESSHGATGRLRFLERRDEIGESAVVNAATALGTRDREADRKVCFTDTRWTEQDNVLAPLDETEFVQALDLLAFERWQRTMSRTRSSASDGMRTGVSSPAR
jgi:hypothetical protein